MKLKWIRAALALFISCAAILGTADYCIDDSIAYRAGSALPANVIIRIQPEQTHIPADTRGNTS